MLKKDEFSTLSRGKLLSTGYNLTQISNNTASKNKIGGDLKW